MNVLQRWWAALWERIAPGEPTQDESGFEQATTLAELEWLMRQRDRPRSWNGPDIG